ncbi:uncharacterized protein BO80DRAFT_465286 [Aspergillus ibericus CBS 121593]|uniref:Uncharacterized protein n=1 Tax=Aspergillus ibericus CBS 121593 TaxID=1448316 RepID=A0A395GXZ7_9EURO|nr:hypothetical protein BO80DRAFT_465286 [Aspergillus ibericus CBS 121593]RAL00461.1 hypothetical protein BO80DRAFT_465286 [Aspergillus ibericus CBS 121593]
MSLIGHVFNKALGKVIPVFIADAGPGFKRLTGANEHLSVQGEANGVKIKGGHAAMDDLQQTVRSLFHHVSFTCSRLRAGDAERWDLPVLFVVRPNMNPTCVIR